VAVSIERIKRPSSRPFAALSILYVCAHSRDRKSRRSRVKRNTEMDNYRAARQRDLGYNERKPVLPFDFDTNVIIVVAEIPYTLYAPVFFCLRSLSHKAY
jgi:hypothetical protein